MALNYKKIAGAAVVIVLVLAPVIASAQDFKSTHFTSRDSILDQSGASSSSTHFQQTGADGQTVTGQSTSTDFIMRSGYLYWDAFTPRTQNWRWYSDVNDETPVTALAAENTAPSSIALNASVKLRITLKETSGVGNHNLKFKIQYSTDPTFATGVSTATEIGSCTTAVLWCYAAGTGSTDNAVISTATLSDAGTCSSGVGIGCGTHNTSGTSTSTFAQTGLAATEYEFILKDENAPYNSTYYFRMYDNTDNLPVLYNTGKSYPSIATTGANLIFSINGLTSGTVTGGVTTSVSTTSTGVGFGTLTVGSQITGAQRLIVTTSATNGYQVYVYQQQGLLGSGSAQISPITSTNTSPAAWNTACLSTVSGCYGYHTTDSVLSGGSTRFSANDTYAQFESAADEIVYNSGPVTNDTNDLIFKTQITNQQQAGTYSGSIFYIVVPSF